MTTPSGTDAAEPTVDAVADLVETWLRDHLSPAWRRAVQEDDKDGLAIERSALDTKAWWRALGDAGLVTPTWPTDLGGLGLSPALAQVVYGVLARYKAPRSENPIGINLAGPVILEWGSPEQQERFLPPIPRHEEVWCQLFSEPGAGSDLASLATIASQEEDRWLVNGQKVWSSLAHNAAWGLLLARSDPSAPKHQGITCFVMDMHARGVTVKPLDNLAGPSSEMRGFYDFNQVFIDDVQIPDAARIGPVNGGWKVAMSVLMRERVSLSGGASSLPGAVAGRTVSQLIDRHSPVLDSEHRKRLADAWIDEQLIALTTQRAAARRSSGQRPGPEGSIGKLVQSEFAQRLQLLALDLEGRSSVAWDPRDKWIGGTVWSFLNSRSRTIAGGTSEINRNVLGERVLGLPREPATDREAPWSQVPRSANSEGGSTR